MQENFKKINNILAEWDPIGIGKKLAKDEYKSYVPSILKCIDNRQNLLSFLEDILINKLGTGYDSQNKKHLEDLQQICHKLFQAYESETTNL